MSSLSQFTGAKPIRVVTYTSGTGTFTPLVSNSWCRVTVVGGGGAGRAAGNLAHSEGGAKGVHALRHGARSCSHCLQRGPLRCQGARHLVH